MLTETKAATQSAKIYGLIAEFDTPEPLLEAARRTRDEGYRHIDAYSPMPVEGLAEAIGFRTNWVQRIVFVAGVLGATGGFMLCWWMTVIAYPHIVAGRPLNSWPAYIPITFESMVLVACLTAVIGMLALNGLPQPYHPVFNVPQFARASRDRFFLCIESSDPKFDFEKTRVFLEQLQPREVMEVEP
jgi:Alternative complex III, ActD subunit